jgi:hypothetical protein
MNEAQRRKRNFRARKVWKLFKVRKKKECGGIDLITLKKLYKHWELHHEDLNEDNYEILNDNFLPCNNQTHEFIHWLWRYYESDPGILDRIKCEMERMRRINQGGENGICQEERTKGSEEKR